MVRAVGMSTCVISVSASCSQSLLSSGTGTRLSSTSVLKKRLNRSESAMSRTEFIRRHQSCSSMRRSSMNAGSVCDTIIFGRLEGRTQPAGRSGLGWEGVA